MNDMTALTLTADMQALVTVVGEGDYRAGVEPDNADRSALAAQILCYFALQTGLSRSGASTETIMVDLVTDMMHLCDRLDIDFSDVMRVAGMHHADEATPSVRR